MRKNLQHIQLAKSQKAKLYSEEQSIDFFAIEGIEQKATYSEQDLDNLEHLDFGAGFAPYLRGIKTIASPDPIATRQEFKICSLADIENLYTKFDSIALDEKSVVFPIEKNSLTLITEYIVAAKKQGLQPESLSGSLQHDVLEKIKNQNTDTNSPEQSLEIITSIFEFTRENIPQLNSICISGQGFQETRIPADMELAYTLAEGLEYIQTGIASGIKMEHLTPQLSFILSIGMNPFIQIAKMRAARMIWAKLIKQFNPKNEEVMALQIQCQTSKVAQQNTLDSITQNCIETTSALFGGASSLVSNFLDNTTDASIDLISLKTPIYLHEETKICKTIDPWAGSFYIENLTDEIAQRTWQRIEEIEAIGGMTKANIAGIPKRAIEAL